MFKRALPLHLLDILGHKDIAQLILTFVGLGTGIMLINISKDVQSYELGQFIHTITGLGQYRKFFLKEILNGRYPRLRCLSLEGGLSQATMNLLSIALKDGRLSNLRSLDLSFSSTGSDVASCLRSIRPTSSIEKLHLRGTNLGDEGLRTVLQVLSRTASITYLDMRDNGIKSKGVLTLAQSMHLRQCLNLRSLLFSTCSYALLSPFFGSIAEGACPNLRELDISNTSVRGRDAVPKLLDALVASPELEILRLAGAQIESFDAEVLCASMLKHRWARNIKVLDLSKNSLRDRGCKALSHVLESGGLTRLEDLLLSHNGLTADGIKELTRAFTSLECPQLHLLDLSKNLFGHRAAEMIGSSFLLRPQLKLKNLKLYMTAIGFHGSFALAKAIKLQALPSLTSLDLRDSSVSPLGFETTIDALSGPAGQTIQELFFRCGGTAPKALRILSLGLRSYMGPTIRVLSIELCMIGCEGASALAVSLPHCRRLETLILNSVLLGPDGASILSKAFEPGMGKPSAGALLTELSLGNNAIGDGGLAAWAQAFEAGGCKNLTVLRLAGNNITKKGLLALGSALKTGACKGLVTLELSDNPLDNQGARILSEIMLSPILPQSFGENPGTPGRPPATLLPTTPQEGKFHDHNSHKPSPAKRLKAGYDMIKNAVSRCLESIGIISSSP